MYEIELKAHVENHAAVTAALHTFATFCGEVKKDDTYYKLQQGDKKITARIRVETSAQQERIFLTYKRKSLQTRADGAAIEVNDEKECSLSDATAVKTLLTDIGFIVSLTKQKIVQCWKYEDALFELCTVPPLGDFLEIEILSETNDGETVSQVQKKLIDLLAKTGISADKIENRYYSDLLREVQKE